MSRSQSVVSGVVSNAFNIGVNLAFAFILPRLMLAQLGESQLGLWHMLMDLLGYYTLTDLGIGRATTKYLSHYTETGEKEKFYQVLSTSQKMNRFLALIAFFMVVVVSIGFPYFAKLPKDSLPISTIHLLVFVTGLKIVIDLMGHTYGGAAFAIGKFRDLNLIDMGLAIVLSTCHIIALYLGWGLVAMAFISIIGAFFRRWLAYRVVKSELQFSHADLPPLDRDTSKQLFSFGVYAFLVQMAQRAGTYSGTLMIGRVWGTDFVAPFGTAQGFSSRCRALSKTVSDVILPTAARLNARNDPIVMQRIGILSSRSMGVICLIFVINVLVMGRPFFEYWLDKEEFAAKVHPLACILIIATTFKLVSSGLTSTIEGIGDVKLLWKYSAAEAIITVVLQWTLLLQYGIVGVAWGVLIAQVSVNGIAFPIAAARILKINPLVLIGRIFGPLILTAIPGYAVAYWLDKVSPPTGLWHVLFLFSLVAITLGVTSFGLCLDPDGRKAVTNNVFKKLKKSKKTKGAHSNSEAKTAAGDTSPPADVKTSAPAGEDSP